MPAKRLTHGSPSVRFHLSAMCAAAWLIAVVACGTEPDETRRDGSDSVAAVDIDSRSTEAAPDTSGDAPTRRVLRAELEARADTDVTGSVRLSPASGGTSVSVTIHGANSGLPYVAELIGGSCASPGSVIAEIGRITAGDQGDGEFREVVDGDLLGDEGSTRAVRVRGAGDPTAIVACGNLAP